MYSAAAVDGEKFWQLVDTNVAAARLQGGNSEVYLTKYA